MRVHLGVIAAALALSACSWQDTRWYSRDVYNPAQVAWSQGVGPNTVSGQALYTSLAGDMRGCANQTVRLVPDSPYARQRFLELYGSDVSGLSNGKNFGEYGPDRSDPRYLASARSTTCNAAGNFKFDGVPNGTYYLLSTMLWSSTTTVDVPGSAAFKRVQVKDGQTAEISLP